MPHPPPRWKTILAFAIIYFVWGATFLAIRVAVQQMPPLLCAAMRFFAAGAVMFGWQLARREALPTGRQWSSLAILAVLIFVVDYGLLFWAEQRVTSGLAAVMLATIPGLMAVSEIVILRTRRMTVRLALALLGGLAGVAVLVLRTSGSSSAPVQPAGAVALLICAISWSIASSLARKLPLPASKATSSASQMVLGGAMLFVLACLFGEPAHFHAHLTRSGWIAVAYLIVFGSIIGFTAYVWLIEHQSPTVVGSYAYVNPLVAVVIGHFVAAEPLGVRGLVGSALILLSVIVLTTAPKAAVAVPDSTELPVEV